MMIAPNHAGVASQSTDIVGDSKAYTVSSDGILMTSRVNQT